MDDGRQTMDDRRHLPETVMVGEVEYDVVLMDSIPTDDPKDQVWGDVQYGSCVIRIDAGLSLQVQRITLIHEIIHAVMVHAGIEDHDEQLITVLSYGLDAVYRRNPGLMVFDGEAALGVSATPETGAGSVCER